MGRFLTIGSQFLRNHSINFMFYIKSLLEGSTQYGNNFFARGLA